MKYIWPLTLIAIGVALAIFACSCGKPNPAHEKAESLSCDLVKIGIKNNSILNSTNDSLLIDLRTQYYREIFDALAGVADTDSKKSVEGLQSCSFRS